MANETAKKEIIPILPATTSLQADLREYIKMGIYSSDALNPIKTD